MYKYFKHITFEHLLIFLSLFLTAGFASLLSKYVLRHKSMFTKRFARRHRLAGLVYLMWLLFGYTHLCGELLIQIEPLEVVFSSFLPMRMGVASCAKLSVKFYDITLGLLGLALTLTAASEFSFHKKVKNPASGALDQRATITLDEMIEHSFYQGVNIVQAAYLHTIDWFPENLCWRLAWLSLATAPWLFRQRFPVNSFSANYAGKPATLIGTLYRLKKAQYILYKHFLLHGLNISVAIQGDAIARAPSFRLYWLSINAAYVLEFFLQTLVKRRYMPQPTMLALNQLLMVATSLPALWVLTNVRPGAAAVSLCLNFLNRGHDFANVAVAASFTVIASLVQW